MKKENTTLNEKFTALHDFGPVGYFTLDHGSTICEMNLSGARMLCKERSELVNRNFRHFISQDTRNIFNDFFRKIFESNSNQACEVRLTVKGNPSVFVYIEGKVYEDEQKCLITAVDITELKRAEETLRKSEKLYRSLFDNMLNGFAYCQMHFDDQDRPCDFTYLAVNSAFETLTGLMDVVGKKVSEVIPGILTTDPKLFDIYGQVAKGGQTERFEMFVESLQMWFWISVYSPEYGYFVAVFDVITEHKRINDALIESEARFRILSENSLTGTYIIDDNRLQYINPALAEIFGYAKEELIGANPLMLIHPDDHALVTEKIQRRMEGEISSVKYEFHGLRKNGETNLILSFGGGVDVGNRRILMGNLLDITELRQKEMELHKFRLAIERSVDAIFITDPEGIIVYTNPAFGQVYGYNSKEVLGETPRLLKSGKVGPEVYHQLWSTLLAKKPFVGEIINKTKKGNLITIEGSNNPILDDSGNIIGFLGIHRNVTDRKLAEEKLIKYNEQLRGLAAHIDRVREEEKLSLARDFHDILGSSLTGLKMFLTILKQNIPDRYLRTHAEIRESMQSMSDLVDSSIDLMRKLISQLRPDTLEELGLVETIRWYSNEIEQRTGIKFLITIFPRKIDLDLKHSIVLFRIFQEILTNIVQHSKASKVIVYIKKQRGTLLMRVKDNGTGITQEEIIRKNSYGILGMKERVILVEGKIDIIGTPGNGTTVSIEMPVK